MSYVREVSDVEIVPLHEERLMQLRALCEYSDGDDGEETGVDSLIEYKNSLEDSWSLDAYALDKIAAVLADDTWPGGADFLSWCDSVVRSTGRK